MPSPANYFDGDHTSAFQHGPKIRWSDLETRAEQYSQTMRIKVSEFATLEIGTEGESSFFLFEETQPRHLDGDLIEWERHYTEVPPARSDYESYSHPYQFLEGTDIGEVVITVQSRLDYTFIQTDVPATDLEVLRAYRMVKIGD